MSLIKKTYRILSFLIILTFLVSCKEQCYTADQFDSYSVIVEAKPTSDGIQPVSITKDFADWHETNLRSNGDEFIIRISGSWTPWNGISMTNSRLNELPLCNICARKNDGTSKNCICLKDQEPQAYPARTCIKGDYDSENEPNGCTCTTDPSEGWDPDPKFSVAYSDSAKYSLLNYYEKDGEVKIADRQESCRFSQGAGLYIGLFGPTGNTVPTRIYHLYSPVEVCNVVRNIDGTCPDDKIAYEFRSRNGRIFMRDDNAGNTGTDTYADDDIYHTQNEVLKFKIYDEEYNNNFGQYNLQILRGVGDSSDRDTVGIIEFMVRLVEDVVLGEIDNNDERQGGILEFMYKSIVQDSGFMNFVRMCLVLYVSIYGMAILAGVAEISKKELMSRVLKIGLILLFTSSNSWIMYKDIVVGFFLDGMNSVISMITSMSLKALDVDSSAMILDAQLDRASNVSSSTRFTYIDNTITMLMSEAAAAKILGLILASPFGILYVIIIYALIFIFIAVMAYAGTVYLINVLKIIFALSLGPLFIVFVLFGQTSQMFKNWISFLAGRAMELVILFLVLFNFVVILNITFTEMLSYEACVELLRMPPKLGIPGVPEPPVLFKIPYLYSYINRGLTEWLVYFMKILGLSLMTYLVLEKVATVAGQLISVSGVGNQGGTGGSRGSSGFALASKFMSGAAGFAAKAAKEAAVPAMYSGLGLAKIGAVVSRESGLSKAVSGAMSGLGRVTGLSYATRAIEQRMGFTVRNPRAIARDLKLDGMIAQAKKVVERDPSKKNLTGAEKDAAIRQAAQSIFTNSQKHSGLASNKISKGEQHSHYLFGLKQEHLQAALHRNLVEKPLLAAVKEQIKGLQDPRRLGGPLFGKEMKDELKKFTSEWMKKNTSVGEEGMKGVFEDKSNFQRSNFEYKLNKKIKDAQHLDAKVAAKAFTRTYHSDEEAQKKNQNKYLSYLQDKKNEQQVRTARLNEDRDKRLAPIRFLSKAAGAAYRAGRSVGFESGRPDLAARNFQRNLANQEARNDGSILSKYGTSRYWGNKLNLTNRNDKTAAAAAAINRNIAKPLKQALFGKTKKTKTDTNESFKTDRKNLGANKIAKEFIKINRSGFESADRQKELREQRQERNSILRDRLSSMDSSNATLKSNHFPDKYIMNDQNRTILKNKDELLKEKEEFAKNRFEREEMQKQLREAAVDSLKSKVESSMDFEKDASFNRVKNMINDGGIEGLIRGNKDTDGVTAESALEQAARLQYLNEKFGLGERNIEKDLIERFNAKINEDIEKTSLSIEDDLRRGDKYGYKQHLKDLESIQNSKAAIFSDKDNRYQKFLQEEVSRYMENVSYKIENNVRGKSQNEDISSSDKKDNFEEESKVKDSMDSTDQKAREGNISIERMTYYNDRDVSDKLDKLLKQNKGKLDDEFEEKEKTRFSASKEQAQKTIDEFYERNLEELRSIDKSNTGKIDSRISTILRRAERDINKSFKLEGETNILDSIAKYDSLKHDMGVKSNLAGKFNELIEKQSKNKEISVESLSKLRDLQIGKIDQEALEDQNVKAVLDSLRAEIIEDRRKVKSDQLAEPLSLEDRKKQHEELDKQIQSSRENIENQIQNVEKSEEEVIRPVIEVEIDDEDIEIKVDKDSEEDSDDNERKGKTAGADNSEKQRELKNKQSDLIKQKADKESEINGLIAKLSKDDPDYHKKKAQYESQLRSALDSLDHEIESLDKQISQEESSSSLGDADNDNKDK